jgi:ATP-dependent helicase/nuclease subunit B
MADATHSAGQDTPRSALAAGHTVVTSTRRLARALKLEFAHQAAAASWPTPEALPWSAWIGASYRECRDYAAEGGGRPCLDDGQSALIWEQLLREDPQAAGLLMPGGAVDGFRDAWRLMQEWRLPPKEVAARAGEDCRTFLRVAGSYQARLDETGWLDGAQLPAQVAAWLGREEDGRQVLFVGFDTFNPAQEEVFRALGSRAQRIDAPYHSGTPDWAGYEDSRTELAAAAAWARAWLEREPGARLGIVVPELEDAAAILEDLLDEALAPRRLLPGGADTERPWNLSLGAGLADAPPVAAALLACSLWGGPLELAEVGRLLRSPWYGGAEVEGAVRARIDAWLRRHAQDRITIEALLGWLRGRDGAPACPLLQLGLQALADELQAGPQRRRPSQWAAAVSRGLRGLGWPGDAAMDSGTWQTVQAWADLLQDFSRLDVVSGAMTRAEALSRLKRMSQLRRFQPETPDLPVQVLGLFETAGLEWDGLWVSGLHDGVLPASLRPCPLLPASMQRERCMPRACPDQELALAQRLMARLGRAAPEVHFSYPLRREDEPLRPSPVITVFNERPDRYTPGPGIAASWFAARRLETIVDERGVPFAGEVAGGTGLLAAQSACPFQAFATYRMSARPLETPVAGVDGRRRGQLLHLALRLLWEELGGQEGLLALNEDSLDERLRAALKAAARRTLGELTAGIVQIEIEEAASRIRELLACERVRPGFEVVDCERAITFEIGPLRIRGQVDRLDRVAGGLAILDYKSGESNPADWSGARPQAPQMPVYALAFAAELVALVYGSLKPGKVGLLGRARSADAFGAILGKQGVMTPDAWQAQLHAWDATLTSLASACAAGDARVDPLRLHGSGSTCAYCHLAILCRRDELLRSGALGDD